jgi:hypothetical protein
MASKNRLSGSSCAPHTRAHTHARRAHTLQAPHDQRAPMNYNKGTLGPQTAVNAEFHYAGKNALAQGKGCAGFTHARGHYEQH